MVEVDISEWLSADLVLGGTNYASLYPEAPAITSGSEVHTLTAVRHNEVAHHDPKKRAKDSNQHLGSLRSIEKPN
jgi:hypothetical protein